MGVASGRKDATQEKAQERWGVSWKQSRSLGIPPRDTPGTLGRFLGVASTRQDSTQETAQERWSVSWKQSRSPGIPPRNTPGTLGRFLGVGNSRQDSTQEMLERFLRRFLRASKNHPRNVSGKTFRGIRKLFLGDSWAFLGSAQERHQRSAGSVSVFVTFLSGGEAVSRGQARPPARVPPAGEIRPQDPCPQSRPGQAAAPGNGPHGTARPGSRRWPHQ